MKKRQDRLEDTLKLLAQKDSEHIHDEVVSSERYNDRDEEVMYEYAKYYISRYILDGNSGRATPDAIAAAAVYTALLMVHCKVTQDVVSEWFDVSPSTIRKHHHEVLKYNLGRDGGSITQT